MITAHSGCENTPMNSRKYLEKAIRIHPDALEVDVRMMDGNLVLDHDGTGALLHLSDALELIAGTDLVLNADLKEKGLERDVIRLSEEKGFPSTRLVFTGCIGDPASMLSGIGAAKVFANPEAFDPDFYDRLSLQYEPDGCVPGDDRMEYVRKLLGTIRDYGFHVINMDYRFCDETFRKVCCDQNVFLSLWTVDDMQEVQVLCKNNTDERIVNITTNYPSEVLRYCPDANQRLSAIV